MRRAFFLVEAVLVEQHGGTVQTKKCISETITNCRRGELRRCESTAWAAKWVRALPVYSKINGCPACLRQFENPVGESLQTPLNEVQQIGKGILSGCPLRGFDSVNGVDSHLTRFSENVPTYNYSVCVINKTLISIHNK